MSTAGADSAPEFHRRCPALPVSLCSQQMLRAHLQPSASDCHQLFACQLVDYLQSSCMALPEYDVTCTAGPIFTAGTHPSRRQAPAAPSSTASIMVNTLPDVHVALLHLQACSLLCSYYCSACLLITTIAQSACSWCRWRPRHLAEQLCVSSLGP